MNKYRFSYRDNYFEVYHDRNNLILRFMLCLILGSVIEFYIIKEQLNLFFSALIALILLLALYSTIKNLKQWIFQIDLENKTIKIRNANLLVNFSDVDCIILFNEAKWLEDSETILTLKLKNNDTIDLASTYNYGLEDQLLKVALEIEKQLALKLINENVIRTNR